MVQRRQRERRLFEVLLPDGARLRQLSLRRIGALLKAEVLKENEPMLRAFEEVAGAAARTSADESWDLRIRF